MKANKKHLRYPIHLNPLCILFFDTKGIQWADTDASVCTGGLNTHYTAIKNTEGIRITPCNLSELV
jgi:hypothetical protein